MNWKQTLFWSFSAAAIFYYFLLFGVFVFVGQEEMQLFIPEWWYIREFLFQPGGFCAVAGQWIFNTTGSLCRRWFSIRFYSLVAGLWSIGSCVVFLTRPTCCSFLYCRSCIWLR